MNPASTVFLVAHAFLSLFILLLFIFFITNDLSKEKCARGMTSSTHTMIDMNLGSTAYKLYYYCDLPRCNKFQPLTSFNSSASIPVLYVPGNADSPYRISRLAFAVHMELINIGLRGVDFDFFTMSFQKERGAFYGPLLEQEIKFTQQSIEFILNRYWQVPEDKRPKSVVLIGNSMGGVVARGVFLNGFDSRKVNTMITLASPHRDPVLNVDYVMDRLYTRINEEIWTSQAVSNVTLVSLHGGIRDQLVRPDLSDMVFIKSKSPAILISRQTTSIPGLWESIDHVRMASCAPLLLVCAQALINLVDLNNTCQIHSNKFTRERILNQHFTYDDYTFDGSDIQSITYDLNQYDVENISVGTDEYYASKNAQKLIIMSDFEELTLLTHFVIYSNLTRDQLKAIRLCKNTTLIGQKYECNDSSRLVAKYEPSYMRFEGSVITVMNLTNFIWFLKDQNFTSLVIPLPRSGLYRFVGLHTSSIMKNVPISKLSSVWRVFSWSAVGSAWKDHRIAVRFNEGNNHTRLPTGNDLLYITNNQQQASMDILQFAPQSPENSYISLFFQFSDSGSLFVFYYYTLIPTFIVFILHAYQACLYLHQYTKILPEDGSEFHFVLFNVNTSVEFHTPTLAVLLILFMVPWLVKVYSSIYLNILLVVLFYLMSSTFLFWGSLLISILILPLRILIVFQFELVKKWELVISVFYSMITFLVVLFTASFLGLVLLFFFLVFHVAKDVSKRAEISRRHFDCQIWSIFIMAILNVPAFVVWCDMIGKQTYEPLVFSNLGDTSFILTTICILVTGVEQVLIHYSIRIKLPIENLMIRKVFESVLFVLIVLAAIFTFFFTLNKVYRLQYFITINLIIGSVAHLYFYRLYKPNKIESPEMNEQELNLMQIQS